VSEDRTVRVWNATPLGEGENPGEELFTLTGHSNCVNTLAFHPTEPLLASGSTDGTIRFWAAGKAFAPDRVFRTALDEVHSIVFSPQGEHLACVGQPVEGCAILETRTGKVQRPLQLDADEWPRRAAFSPDGKLVAGCNGDGPILLWDCETGKPRRLEGNLPWTFGAAFSPERGRSLLAVTSTAGEVYLWNHETGQQVRPPLPHVAATALAFTPDGTRLVTVGWDDVVRVWDTKEWKVVEFMRDPNGHPNAVAFGPDGKLDAWGGCDSTVKVWRLGTEEVVTRRGHRNWVWDVAFGPGGGIIASASRDGTVKIWKTPALESK
jgi:WD40 repeat protein